MFEFEKIELIDGRWRKEMDQIRFWLNCLDSDLRDSHLQNQQQNVSRSDNDETIKEIDWMLTSICLELSGDCVGAKQIFF